MGRRNWSLVPSCEHALKKLSKKHPSLQHVVPNLLTKIAGHGPTRICRRIQYQGGTPVFKVRVPIRGMGLSQAARLIYYCDETQVVGLFLFVKGDQENVPPKEILGALKQAGLNHPRGSLPSQPGRSGPLSTSKESG